MASTYTLAEPVTYEKDVRKSLFLVNASPVSSSDDALRFIRHVSVVDATHNCWAYKVGQAYRTDDDGEPGGTAGRPILRAIEGQTMDRVVVVVTRWFGGIKLGAGGLMRAYGGAASECLRLGTSVCVVERSDLDFHCAFADMALVRARLDDWDCIISSENFDEKGVFLRISVPSDHATGVSQRLVDLTAGRSRPRAADADETSW